MLGNGIVVDEPNNLIAIAKIPLKEAQQRLCRISRADDDDRLVTKPALFQKLQKQIANGVYEEECIKEEKCQRHATDKDVRAEKIKENDEADHAVENSIKRIAENVQYRAHHPIRIRTPEKEDEDARNPAVEVECRNRVQRIAVPKEGELCARDNRDLFCQQDGKVIRKDCTENRCRMPEAKTSHVLLLSLFVIYFK